MKKKMTLDEFKKYCLTNDINIVDKWNFTKFKIVCEKCNSNNIQVGYTPDEYGHGSELTGSWLEEESSLLVKCLDCGHAMTLKLRED